MATVLRSKLSKNNPYYISKHRYYELKHFCLQYNEWKQELRKTEGYMGRTSSLSGAHTSSSVTDEVSAMAQKREIYLDRIRLVDEAAVKAGGDMSKYILDGVTNELSYEVMCARGYVPCCKDVYYALYRRFFWVLDQTRN